MRSFNEILTMVANAVNSRFYSGVSSIKEEVLKSATQIYIEEMRLSKEKKR